MSKVCVKCNTPKASLSFRQWRVYTPTGTANGHRKMYCALCEDSMYANSVDDQLQVAIKLRKAEVGIERKAEAHRKKLAADRAANEKKSEMQKAVDGDNKPARTQEEDFERELLQRELAKRSLLEFIKRFNPTYQAGWVHEDICRRLKKFLNAMNAGQSPRLMLFMPPRHGKSMIASHHFPAWALGQFPELEIIAASYGVSLPNKFSRQVRSFLRDKRYQVLFPTTKLDRTNENVEGWSTTKGGGYVPAGVGGGITGKGAHIFILDDPIKDAEEADSETVRQNIWDWWGSTAYTRLAPNAGVLVIQCMTGDTPVLMADGTERPLADIRVGDEIATYDEGRLSTAPVLNHASQGYDDVFAMTMSSGRVVRANERHPFLVENEEGELSWIRLKNLKPTQKIVTLKDSGGSGKVSSALKKGAKNRSVAEGSVRHTITGINGNSVTALRRLMAALTATHILSIDITSHLKNTKLCIKSRTVIARFVGYLSRWLLPLSIGRIRYASITAMIRAKFADSCATPVISSLNEGAPQKSSNQRYDTEDFTTQTIVSIEPAGVEEVFDIQVEGTENFIANVIVSHNTRWHDDDPSGRMIQQMHEELKEAEELKLVWKESGMDEDEVEAKYQQCLSEIDKWEVIDYPAIANHDEYLNLDGTVTEEPKAEKSKFLRMKGDALHPDRFDYTRLMKIKRTLQPRHWSALYQQNPVPDEGSYFTKGGFRYMPPQDISRMPVCIAWDLAISKTQTADYSVGTVGVLNQYDQIVVVEVIRGRWDTYEIVENMLEVYKRYAAMCVSPPLVGIERGQLELAIRPHLNKRMEETRLYMSFDENLKPVTDKIMRARPLQGRMLQGKVAFINEAPWMDDVKHEMLRFPNGTHDDIVDSLAWLIRMFATISPPSEIKPKKIKGWRDKLRISGTRHPMSA